MAPVPRAVLETVRRASSWGALGVTAMRLGCCRTELFNRTPAGTGLTVGQVGGMLAVLAARPQRRRWSGARRNSPSVRSDGQSGDFIQFDGKCGAKRGAGSTRAPPAGPPGGAHDQSRVSGREDQHCRRCRDHNETHDASNVGGRLMKGRRPPLFDPARRSLSCRTKSYNASMA